MDLSTILRQVLYKNRKAKNDFDVNVANPKGDKVKSLFDRIRSSYCFLAIGIAIQKKDSDDINKKVNEIKEFVKEKYPEVDIEVINHKTNNYYH